MIIGGLTELGITAAAKKVSRIEFYLSELERWNARYGFIKADARELVSRHVLDALAGLKLLTALVPVGGSVLDVGTGAGFPGLPLALFVTDRRFTLCERKSRERAFLSGTVALLKLDHVAVADDLASLPAVRFDAVTFRAVTSLIDMYALVRRLLAQRGVLFSYKGKREKIETEIAGLEGLGLETEIHDVSRPEGNRERHIVIVRQVAPAP